MAKIAYIFQARALSGGSIDHVASEAAANGIPEQAGRVWGVPVDEVDRRGRHVRVELDEADRVDLEDAFPGSRRASVPWGKVRFGPADEVTLAELETRDEEDL